MRCKSRDIHYHAPDRGAPQCFDCGSTKTRPDVVLFGEALNKKIFNGADQWIKREADVVIVIGSSLNVHPAAGMVMDVLGSKRVILINKDRTPFNSWIKEVYAEDADVVIDEVLKGL